MQPSAMNLLLTQLESTNNHLPSNRTIPASIMTASLWIMHQSTVDEKRLRKNVCKLRVNALHSTKSHVQTALATSKDNYSHQHHLIHGSGQGSGSNEQTFVSIPMIKRIEKISKFWHSYNPVGIINGAPTYRDLSIMLEYLIIYPQKEKI